VFAEYGEAFQRRFVPHLETTEVTALVEAPGGFHLTLATGEMLTARRVVLAVGISHFANLPSQLTALPRTLVSHSSQQPDLSVFAGRDVVVLGAGASALDCAALLVKANASVRLSARASAIHFHNGPTRVPRPLKDRVLSPSSGLGPGWKSRLSCDLPLLFHALPETLRLRFVREHLGPAPGWWTRKMVEGKVPFHLGQTLRSAHEKQNRIVLSLDRADGTSETLTADHVIAATGYHPDVQRLDFLSARLRDRIRTVASSPTLTRDFESSVPGLYFVGPAAANSFGPVSRFAYGAGFASRRLARHLNRDRVTVAAHRDRAREPLQVTDAALG